MNNTLQLQRFRPNPPDPAGVLSWIHIGDLHMRSAAQQNHLDLQAIVLSINAVFADSITFVFLPGDNADHGDTEAYSVIQHALDPLHLPWCAILGDHDVEQNSFENFKAFLSEKTHYAFTVGEVQFLALNAFDLPEPTSFAVLPAQLRWIEDNLHSATSNGRTTVLLLHCYPSDLKQGGEALTRLISSYGVKVVDMGHTHYNEISHDGSTIYTATRSTGQIEEGPVGFSITNLDRDAVSWRFFELGHLPAVMITSPADERLVADAPAPGAPPAPTLRVRAKVWAEDHVVKVTASLPDATVSMHRVPGSRVWEATLPCAHLTSPLCPLRVTALDSRGNIGGDEIQVLLGTDRPARQRATRDQDNVLEAWPEHGLLGTQLGPNKNGRKW